MIDDLQAQIDEETEKNEDTKTQFVSEIDAWKKKFIELNRLHFKFLLLENSILYKKN
jgi:hypothetical protein